MPDQAATIRTGATLCHRIKHPGNNLHEELQYKDCHSQQVRVAIMFPCDQELLCMTLRFVRIFRCMIERFRTRQANIRGRMVPGLQDNPRQIVRYVKKSSALAALEPTFKEKTEAMIQRLDKMFDLQTIAPSGQKKGHRNQRVKEHRIRDDASFYGDESSSVEEDNCSIVSPP